MQDNSDGEMRAQVDAQTLQQSIDELRKSLTVVLADAQFLQRQSRRGPEVPPAELEKRAQVIASAAIDMIETGASYQLRRKDAYLMDRHCQGTTKSGVPFGAAVWRAGLCRWHHPDLEAQRAEARRADGRARANATRARKGLRQASLSLREMDGLLCFTMTKVADGETSTGVATALGTLARAVIAEREAGEIAERLERMETALAERKGA